MLILESANCYIEDRQGFGKAKGTIDSALKRVFQKVFATAQHVQTLRQALVGYKVLAAGIPVKGNAKSLRS